MVPGLSKSLVNASESGVKRKKFRQTCCDNRVLTTRVITQTDTFSLHLLSKGFRHGTCAQSSASPGLGSTDMTAAEDLSAFLSRVADAAENFWAADDRRVALRAAAALLTPHKAGFQKHIVVEVATEYGAVLLATANSASDEEATKFHLHVLGLDGWRFSSTAGKSTPIAHSAPSTLHVRELERDELGDFVVRFSIAYEDMRKRVGKERSASNAHGGHQRTPSCIAALAAWVTDNPAAQGSKELCATDMQLLPRGGFTDVGRHTGGEARETDEALALTLLHFALFAADPALGTPGLVFEHAVTEFRVDQAFAALESLEAQAATLHPLAPEAVDAVVLPLADAARRASRIAETGLADLTSILRSCESARARLDKATADSGHSVASAYGLVAPPPAAVAALPSPQVAVQAPPQAPSAGESGSVIVCSAYSVVP